VMAVLVRMIVRTGREAPSRALVAMATLVAVALAATPGLAGHASTGRWSALALVTQTASSVTAIQSGEPATTNVARG